MQSHKSFFDLTQTNPALVPLQASLNKIYELFSIYSKPEDNLTCLDCGPSEEELIIFNSHDLQNFPFDFLRSLEFYNETWGSWGSEAEVKYFLPRVLECLTYLIVNPNESDIEISIMDVSIRYKLSNEDLWIPEELSAIDGFSRNLFEHYLEHGNLVIIDAVFDLVLSCRWDVALMLDMIKASERREEFILAMFNEWIIIERKGGWFGGYYLDVDGQKEEILRHILGDTKLLMQLEFLSRKPWSNLLLKGFKKLDHER